MRYFVRMNYITNKPVTLYKFDPTNVVEQVWVGRWIDASNVIVESLFKSGELEEVKRDFAEDNFPQAFSRA